MSSEMLISLSSLIQIVKIILNWVTEHFPDFEENDRMTTFMDWFEEKLIEDVSHSYSVADACVHLKSSLSPFAGQGW